VSDSSPETSKPDTQKMAEATRALAARTEGDQPGEDTIAHQPDADGREPLDTKMAQQGHPDSQEPVARDARDLNSGGQSDR
jgi:hypothetical protein